VELGLETTGGSTFKMAFSRSARAIFSKSEEAAAKALAFTNAKTARMRRILKEAITWNSVL
jgi:hypothetical protein